MTNPMDRLPLGDYEPFRSWSGHPRSWGAKDSGWRAWFGGKVVDGLCEVLDEHLAAECDGFPAVIGCVPWLNKEAVVDRLLKMTACCVVLDKGACIIPERLVNSGVGFPNYALPQLEDKAAAVNGGPLIVGPYTPQGATEYDLGPVRRLGWLRGAGKPLLHAKLLVLGQLDTYYLDAPGEYSRYGFVPQSIWFGSANCTDPSRSHLEVGFVCDDSSLIQDATDFVANVIAFSEPVGTACVGPEPNLIAFEYDDDAMVAACEEQYLTHLEEEAQNAQAQSYFEREDEDGDGEH